MNAYNTWVADCRLATATRQDVGHSRPSTASRSLPFNLGYWSGDHNAYWIDELYWKCESKRSIFNFVCWALQWQWQWQPLASRLTISGRFMFLSVMIFSGLKKYSKLKYGPRWSCGTDRVRKSFHLPETPVTQSSCSLPSNEWLTTLQVDN